MNLPALDVSHYLLFPPPHLQLTIMAILIIIINPINQLSPSISDAQATSLSKSSNHLLPLGRYDASSSSVKSRLCCQNEITTINEDGFTYVEKLPNEQTNKQLTTYAHGSDKEDKKSLEEINSNSFANIVAPIPTTSPSSASSSSFFRHNVAQPVEATAKRIATTHHVSTSFRSGSLDSNEISNYTFDTSHDASIHNDEQQRTDRIAQLRKAQVIETNESLIISTTFPYARCKNATVIGSDRNSGDSSTQTVTATSETHHANDWTAATTTTPNITATAQNSVVIVGSAPKLGTEVNNRYSNASEFSLSLPATQANCNSNNNISNNNINNNRRNNNSSNNNSNNNSSSSSMKELQQLDRVEEVAMKVSATTTTTTTKDDNSSAYSDLATVLGGTADENNKRPSGARITKRPKRRAHLQQAPSFGQPIGNVTAVAGRDVRLICTVDNLGHYQVAWLKLESKTILSIDTNIITTNYRIFLIPDEEERKWVLHIKDVQESDRGYYQCQLNTIPMRSITGHLEVVVSPSIIESQSSQQVTVDEYSNVTLTCKTYAHPKASTTWKRDDGMPIKLNGWPDNNNNNDNNDLISSRLNIYSQTNDDNNSNYYNDYRRMPVAVSDDHLLNETTKQQENFYLAKTGKLTIRDTTATATTATKQRSIKSRGNSLVNDDDDDDDGDDDVDSHRVIYNNDSDDDDIVGGAISVATNPLKAGKTLGAISSSIENQYKSDKLTLINVNRSFTGLYICTSSNGIPPSATKRIPLYINFPPKTSLLNQYISANVGDTIELECIIEAYPKSSNHWAKIPNGGDMAWTQILGPDHGNVVEGTLLDNTNSNNNSATAQIHLNYHPHNRLNNRSIRDKVINSISSRKSIGSVTNSNADTVTVTLDQIQSNKINNESSINEERVYVSVKQSSVNSYTNQLKLTIPSLRRQDFGKYTCFARNNFGASESSVLIREIVKTSEYLPQRPANTLQSDYTNHQPQQPTSIADQPKRMVNNITHRIKHSGTIVGDHNPFLTTNKIVYDEKYIQAIKARQQNLNQNYNSNMDQTIQRMKYKNAQNGGHLLLRVPSFNLLLLFTTMTLLLSIIIT